MASTTEALSQANDNQRRNNMIEYDRIFPDD
jgi:hypothetical protein